MHSFNWTNPDEHLCDEDVSRKGDEVYIHHNGDYSGEVIVNVPEAMWDRIFQQSENPSQGRIEFKLPANLLKSFGRNATIRDAIGALENLYEPEG